MDNQVSIYTSDTNDIITDDPVSYTVENFINDTFGGYSNEIFYDYTKLFFIIIVLVVGFRLVTLLFSK